jgi:hypothetical protein
MSAPTHMTAIPVYWRTRFGSVGERQAGPDADGWMTVRRLSDDAIREWNISELSPLTAAEAIKSLSEDEA